MQVVHALSSSFAVIGDKAEVLNIVFFRQIPCGEQNFAQQLGVSVLGFVQAADVFFGDNQQVRRRLRVEVFKDQDIFVLVDDLAFYFAVGYGTKYAVHVHII